MWRILVIGFLLPVAFAQSFYVSTPAGPLRGGVTEAFKVAYLLGIPYAKAARWKRPVMVTEWEGVLEAARVQSRYAPTYVYLVTYVSPVFPQLGSFHGIEIPLLFGTESTWPFWMLFSTVPALEQGQLLAKQLQERWVNFASAGDPGGWPGYQSGSALRIDTTFSVIPDPFVERCAIFQ